MDSTALKKQLRKNLLKERQELDRDWVKEASKKIFLNFHAAFGHLKPEYVHVFQSISENNEVDTSFFMKHFGSMPQNKGLIVPVMLHGHENLSHVMIGNDVEMVKNRWGIPEPKMPRSYVKETQPDLIIVPLLAFDERGHRLGYGKGYYDRFLAKTRPDCLKIGVCFQFGMQPILLPVSEHDIPLDAVITEVGTYNFNDNKKS